MNKYKVNTKDLLGLELGFENCESMFIPIEAFKVLKLDGQGNVQAVINLRDTINYKTCAHKRLTPLERINKYNDITSIELAYKNKNITYEIKWWENPNPYIMEQENKYQTSNLIAYDKLYLKILEKERHISEEI